MAGSYIDSQELEWKDASIATLGITIRGLRGFRYKKSTDSEHLHAAGDEAISIQSGNKKVDGSIKFLKSEIDRLNRAARQAGYDDFGDVPWQLVTITAVYRQAYGRQQETDIINGVKFTDWEKAMEQGAKMMEVEVPFLAMRIKSL